MLLNLPESARERKPSLGQGVVSALLHMSLIGGVTLGSHAAAGPALEKPKEVVVMFREPTAEPRPAATTARPAPIPTNLAPPEFPSLVDLTIVPDHLPSLSAVIGSVAVDSFARLPVDPVATGAVEASGAPFLESAVEKAIVPLGGNPSPRYPRVLAQAGVEGQVHAQFVVDSAGRVERGSIRIVRSDHGLFEQSVREVLARMRFIPAEVGGRRVRQLAQQPFAFAIARP